MGRGAFAFLVVASLHMGGCAPTRTPVPVGIVPEPPSVSVADRRAGLNVRQEMLRQFPEVENHRVREPVVSVVNQLLRASGSEPARWSVTVLKDDQVANAAATRGNEVFVWTGMLKMTRNSSELATVLAHEIAHVLAGHVVPTEDEMFRQVLSQVAGAVVGGVVERETAGAGQLAAGLATETAKGVAVNPYTKMLELEADTIGLYLMADAGFDPRAALTFWERFGQNSAGFIEFFSSHPLSQERIVNLQNNMPPAVKRFRAVKQ